MPEPAPPPRSVPGTLLVVGILAAAIGGTAALRSGRVPAGSLPATTWPDMRIDVNTATEYELGALPGIGPALAGRIAADRAARGPFESIDDLARVNGIGPKLVERIAPYAIVFAVPPKATMSRKGESQMTFCNLTALSLACLAVLGGEAHAGEEPTGSCCMPLIACTDGQTELECVTAGGVYGGDGSSCPLLSGDDCNKNGMDDAIDLYCGPSSDDNGDGIPDECGLGGACCVPLVGCTNGVSAPDCLAQGGFYQGDGAVCPLLSGEDCNKNGMDDTIDLLCGPSSDANGDGVPDECQAPCPGDVNNDGAVGIEDFLMLLAAWGPNPGHPADLDGDDVVGIADFLALLAAWGPC